MVNMEKDPTVVRVWEDRAWYVRTQRTDFAEWKNTLRRQGGVRPVSLVKE
jgi:hypothetical protein